MKIGFTGTREGMTRAQERTLKILLDGLDVTSFAHGDCTGSDEEAARIAHHRGIPLVCHPPTVTASRAFTEFNDEVRTSRHYHDRNRVIVDECDLLIACPKESAEPTGEQVGGTWYTIKYARRKRKKRKIIYPDGSVTEV